MMKTIVALTLTLMFALTLCATASAAASSTYTLTFDFDHLDDDITRLNDMLSSMKLAHLDLNDYRSYLSITTDGNDVVIDRRLGLTTGVFTAELAEGDEGYTYQIMTDVVDLDVDNETYLQHWRDTHPNMVHRIVIRISYESCDGYVILYHARAN